jgi:hypothetical protein
VVAPVASITDIVGRAGERGGAKLSEDSASQEKIASKKIKLAKYGLKFQSAGTLVTIGDRIGKDTPLIKETDGKKEKMQEVNDITDKGEVNDIMDKGEVNDRVRSRGKGGGSRDRGKGDGSRDGGEGGGSRDRGKGDGSRDGGEGEGDGSKARPGKAENRTNMSVARREMDRRKLIDQTKASYTTKWEKAGSSRQKQLGIPSAPSNDDKAPPPLMSRQRELTMEKQAEHTSDDEEDTGFTRAIIKKTPKFKFKIAK